MRFCGNTGRFSHITFPSCCLYCFSWAKAAKNGVFHDIEKIYVRQITPLQRLAQLGPRKGMWEKRRICSFSRMATRPQKRFGSVWKSYVRIAHVAHNVWCKSDNYSGEICTIILVMSYLKTVRLMRLVNGYESSSCLRSLVCLKTRLTINVSKLKAFHGIVRHQPPE